MKIAKEFRWEMGHRLQHHKGKCVNLHGHSYKMIVEFNGDIAKDGMVIDYFDVKKIIAPIVDKLDHSVVISKDDTALLEAVKQLGSDYVIIDYESTAENLCHYFIDRIKETELPNNITELTVRVMETDNTYAEEKSVLK